MRDRLEGGQPDEGFSQPFREQFLYFMDDDFNTPRGLSVLFDIITACNKILDGSNPKGRQGGLMICQGID